ncbi:thioredoxin family protein [Pontibacillus litoralis]|uniref:Thioredoxin n=1 Tax=Pontibacillus litoralis JSM 072002 TaxID=1385512 RepID=A0A0A5G826_9BACI|nr:thioredoxin family protein [Pontibacillus litoralis]KGX88189.1 thioredoxin [Pontibacillus litoralis JSM 072002]
MNQAQTIEEVRSFVQDNQVTLVYISRENCSVCHSLLPQVEQLLQQYPNIASLHVDAEKIPSIAAEYEIFTVPVLIVSVDGKEMFRKARFVPMEELNQQLHKLIDALH